MADGINFIIDQVNAGQSFTARAADASKSTAGIFDTPGDPDKPLAFVAAGGGFTSEGRPMDEECSQIGTIGICAMVFEFGRLR